MISNNVDITHLEDKLAELEKQGKTSMLLAVDKQIAGIVAAMDTPKDNAAEVIKQLKGIRLEVAMLTGDNERTAKAIAKQLGIDTAFGLLGPIIAAGAMAFSSLFVVSNSQP